MKRYALAAAALLLFAADAQARSPDGFNRWVSIVNDTSETMWSFRASNISEPGWQENILGRDVLYPGEYVDVLVDDGSGYCMYDLRAEFVDGTLAERFDFDVCAAGSWTVYD